MIQRQPDNASHDARSRSLWPLWLGAIGPLALVALLTTWLNAWPLRWQFSATALIVVVVWLVGRRLNRAVVGRLRAITNLLDGLREGEFTLRAVVPATTSAPPAVAHDDPLDALARAANELGASLRHRRWSARETAALLDVLLERLDAAVLLIDDTARLVTANPAACALLGLPHASLIGRACAEVGLGPFVGAASGRVIDHAFAARSGRWELRRAAVRLEGREHQLLVISDLTRPLREEERRAWERLVQVLRHEVNNSLAPITSLADSLARRVDRASRSDAFAGDPDAGELLGDLGEGLGVIASRATGLTRFLAAYTRLSRLPEPSLRAQPIGPVLRRIAALQTAVPVAVSPDDGPEVLIDTAQLEQALLNLVTNAAEATLERWPAGTETPGIVIEHRPSPAEPGFLEVRVIDQGVGKPVSENLFVPFFTTKPNGTGIGLVLSRRIIEAHGGRLTLQSRDDELVGCVASLTLRLASGKAQAADQRSASAHQDPFATPAPSESNASQLP